MRNPRDYRAGVRLLAAALLMLGASSAGQAAPTAATVEAIDACMRANIPPALQIRQFSLNAVDHNGAGRLMKGRLYAIRDNGLLRTMLRIDSPPDLRGAAYLLREGEAAQQDAMYVYLPALNKVRRIMGGTQDNPLFGTDLSYADLKQISHAFSGGQIELEKTDKIDGRDTYILGLIPDASQQSRYSRIRTWSTVSPAWRCAPSSSPMGKHASATAHRPKICSRPDRTGMSPRASWKISANTAARS